MGQPVISCGFTHIEQWAHMPCEARRDAERHTERCEPVVVCLITFMLLFLRIMQLTYVAKYACTHLFETLFQQSQTLGLFDFFSAYKALLARVRNAGTSTVELEEDKELSLSLSQPRANVRELSELVERWTATFVRIRRLCNLRARADACPGGAAVSVQDAHCRQEAALPELSTLSAQDQVVLPPQICSRYTASRDSHPRTGARVERRWSARLLWTTTANENCTDICQISNRYRPFAA